MQPQPDPLRRTVDGAFPSLAFDRPPLSSARCMVAQALLRTVRSLASAAATTALILLATGLAGCAGEPPLRRHLALAPGQKSVVRYIDVKGTLALSLQNASAAAATDVYRTDSGAIDPGAKVVADDDLQALLDIFSERGLFAAAANEVPADALDALIVQQGGQRWVFPRRLRGVQQAESAFHEGRAYFLALYNDVTAYHGTGDDRPDFKSEQRRAADDGRAARAKLERLRGGAR